jgi:hypothetical protein
MKKSLFTLLSYGAAFSVLNLLNKKDPSGPCNPGFGLLFFLAIAPVMVVFLLVNLVKVLMGHKSNIKLMAIHCVAAVCWFLLWKGVF